jgi:catechol 2,3-dioxygenase-like lactoylglutathione lyase family enzyme
VIDHAAIRVPDLAAARRFYDAVFGALGVACVGADADWIGYGPRADADHPWRGYVSIRRGAPAGPGLLWAFHAADAVQVDAFRAAGLAAGGRDGGGATPDPAGAPAPARIAILLDPAGHRVAAVWRG